MLLGEKVDLLGFLSVPLLIEFYKLVKKVLANLLKWLSHVNFTFELWMHCKERSSIEFLKGRHEDYLDVFDCKEVKVAQVKLGCDTIDEKIIIYLFKISLAVRDVTIIVHIFSGFIHLVKTLCVHLFAATFIKHLGIEIFFS